MREFAETVELVTEKIRDDRYFRHDLAGDLSVGRFVCLQHADDLFSFLFGLLHVLHAEDHGSRYTGKKVCAGYVRNDGIAAVSEDIGDHVRCGGLTVRTGNGDAVAARTELFQYLRIDLNGDLSRKCGRASSHQAQSQMRALCGKYCDVKPDRCHNYLRLIP